MTNPLLIIRLLLPVLVVLSLSTALMAQPSRDRVLGDLSFNELEEQTEVRIEFNFPVRYIRHFPVTSGQDLRIQLVPMAIGNTERDALFKREAITAKRHNAADISEVIYEGDSANGLQLTVYFVKEKTFSVEQGNDYRSMMLIVKNSAPHPGPAAVEAVKSPVAEVKSQVAIAEVASPEEEAGQQPAPAPQEDLQNRYAINLKSSLTPIDRTALPTLQLTKQLQLYTTEFTQKGTTWYRLRAGFFHTEQEAKALFEILKKDFPEAWVTIAPESDHKAAKELSEVVTAPEEKSAPVVEQPKKGAQPATATQEGLLKPMEQKAVGLRAADDMTEKSRAEPLTDARSSARPEELQRFMAANRYAINLDSSLTPYDPATIAAMQLTKQHQLYTTEFVKNGTTWYRLRIGFFHSEQEAKSLIEKFKKDYPEAWVTTVPESDYMAAKGLSEVVTAPDVEQPFAEPTEQELQPTTATQVELATPIEQKIIGFQATDYMKEKPQPEPLAVANSEARQKEQQLFDEAEKALVDNDYHRAVQIYTKLSQSDDPVISQKAQEFLGLARERNGQIAHAKAEYEKYLELYPEGESAERVKQRLAGLLTARATPKERLKKGKDVATNAWQTDANGSFSQFYDRAVTYTQRDETNVNRSSLSTDFDINTRTRNDNYDIRTTFIGGYENDFRKDGEDDFRVSSLNIDGLSRRHNVSSRIGRQSLSSGGVLGRFDGGLLSWQTNDYVTVNLVAGFPVDSTTDTEIDVDRPFYGINLDLGTFAKVLDFNTFFISQNVDGIIDRQAVGGEVRYFSGPLSFFTLIDYDVSYNDLNTALFTANYTFASLTSFNVSIDHRNSPALTTSNALQGQTADSIDALMQTYTKDEIRQLARDRTATANTYTFSITHPINSKFQVSGDLAVSEYSNTPASGGIEAQPGTDFEYYYSLQFVGSSLIKEGDTTILGLRYADTDRSHAYSASINTRYPVSREFRINPAAVVNYRSNKEDDGTQWNFRPLLRMEYNWRRRYHFEIEGGGEWSSQKWADQKDDTKGYFLSAGYRINF